MKKVAILLLAILIFSCSDDDEKGTVENKGQWAMIFNESVKNDSNPVDKTEKFMFDGERLIQHIIKQRYFEEEISNEVNLSYSDNQVTVTTDYLTLVTLISFLHHVGILQIIKFGEQKNKNIWKAFM